MVRGVHEPSESSALEDWTRFRSLGSPKVWRDRERPGNSRSVVASRPSDPRCGVEKTAPFGSGAKEHCTRTEGHPQDARAVVDVESHRIGVRVLSELPARRSLGTPEDVAAPPEIDTREESHMEPENGPSEDLLSRFHVNFPGVVRYLQVGNSCIAPCLEVQEHLLNG